MNPVGYRLRIYKHRLYDGLLSFKYYNPFYRNGTCNLSKQTKISRRICNRLRRVWVLIFVMVLCLLFFTWPNYEYVIDDGQIFPFEPDVEEDFPVGDLNVSKISKIIHWTYKDTSLPPAFHDNVRSFVENNPDWTFYFWTDEASERFIADTHPELLATYNGYHGHRAHIKRADFIRYVVLYELGGIYVDLDVFDFRPLDRLITKYTCIFPTEPFEHAVLRAGVSYLINNAIMICQAKHPFLKSILENLPRFQNIQFVNDATGPGFITTAYKMYNNIGYDTVTSEKDIPRRKNDNSPYFYKGSRSDDHPDSVYVPNSQYFATSVDMKGIFDYRVCYYPENLDNLKRRACASFLKRGTSTTRNRFTFLDHRFYRSYGIFSFYIHWKLYLWIFAVDIRDLVPNVQLYD